jgi:hypothetical protein
MAGESQFKNSLFGFDKQAVAEYIENSAKRVSILKNEKEKLDLRCIALEEDLTDRTAELEALRAENAALIERLASGEERAAAAVDRASRLESELEALNAVITGYKEKADIYDAARDRIAGLELSASKRAVDIEKKAEKRSAEIVRSCKLYLASVKAKYTKVSEETRQSSDYIISELNRLSDRLSVLSAIFGEKTDAFDFIDAGDKTETNVIKLLETV